MTNSTTTLNPQSASGAPFTATEAPAQHCPSPSPAASGQSFDLQKMVFDIAKGGARVHQLAHAEELLVDAAAELHVALIQQTPSDDEIIMDHVRKAHDQIGRALKQVRAAK